jgi:hypothetical protein
MKNGFEATRHVIQAIERLNIKYMLVGSLSSMAYGIPRSTKDADVVIAVEPKDLDRLFEELGSDFELDPQGTFEMVTGTLRHHLRVPSVKFEIELFLLSDDPHDQSRFERRRSFPSEQLGVNAVIPTAEDVIIMKLRWLAIAKRAKDHDDVRDIIAVQGDEMLDWDYIHYWTGLHQTRTLLDGIRESIPPLD